MTLTTNNLASFADRAAKHKELGRKAGRKNCNDEEKWYQMGKFDAVCELVKEHVSEQEYREWRATVDAKVEALNWEE